MRACRWRCGRRGGTAFGAAQTLDLRGRWHPHPPSVAAAADGRAVAVWAAVGRDIEHAAIWAAIRPAGATTFGAPMRLTDVGPFPGLPRVDINDAGQAVVAWSGRRGVRAAVLSPGSTSFAAPQRLRTRMQPLGGSGILPDDPLASDVEVNERGDALVVWAGLTENDRYVVQSAAMTAGSTTFARTRLVARASGQLSTFDAELDDAGNATAVWGAGAAHEDVTMVVRPAGGSYGQPVTLTPGRRRGGSPSIDSDGQTVAVAFTQWIQLHRAQLAVASWSGTPPQRIASATATVPQSRDILSSTVAVGPGGRTLVAWMGLPLRGPFVRAAYRAAPGDPLQRVPVQADRTAVFIDGLAARFDELGRATIGWREDNGADVIRAAVVDTSR